jgi:integrase
MKRSAAHIDRTDRRLRNYFNASVFDPLASMTESKAKQLYGALRERPTRTGRPPSDDEQLNTLAQIKTFGSWCMDEKHVAKNPFRSVRPIGRKKRGKAQLTRNEARKYLIAALELDPEEAVAGSLPLTSAMGASEVIERIVREVDDGGTILRISSGKTANREREVDLPEILQGPMATLIEGKAPRDRIFPGRDRHWVRRVVKKICRMAKVPVVTAHGLRGTSATMGRASGLSSHAVVAHLGHSSYSVTKRHYLAPGTEERAQQRATLAVLRGGKSSGDTQ